jgi:hypothetical protein
MCSCAPVYAVFPLLSFHSDYVIVQIEQRGGVRMSRELEQWLLEEREAGEDRLTILLERLKADGRFKDWVLAVEDKKIREQFYKEYGIE